ncbi:uncharacterized protein GIQ15_06871 [Arthroderma uncinatum]|uniref:uncharacterized protein n=1 Tax=Arthroderma uncinatum TaxID=74035 RepID=UPI00144AC02F|nr:uncharacterized protein GIQ15_06871 [Arthroderma uncinatum]KAF3479895.1 hypothetical protein GIQ15_06871 [Arthroderma uncinatum]
MHQNIISADGCPTRPNITSKNSSFTIRPARSTKDIQATVTLIQAYTISLGIDLTFQDFSTEIASFPGKYAPPEGEILLAIDDQPNAGVDGDGEVLGCICMRPLIPRIFSSKDTNTVSQTITSSEKRYCEMKRLYVLPSTRGMGVGKALVMALLQVARDRGYNEMKLDTLRHMRAPIELYRSLGFTDIEKYYETPLDETVFLGLEL